MTPRVVIDGLTWCAGCRRAVDRGWPHTDNCPYYEHRDEEELKRERMAVIDARIDASKSRVRL